MDRCYVYKITCKSNKKVYIGISNNPERRFKEHLGRSYDKANIGYSSHLSRSIRKYKEENFFMDVLLEGTRFYCAFMEVRLIESYNSFGDGFNGSQGGEGTSYLNPWNKDSKGVCKSNKTSFKKGKIPPTTKMTKECITRLTDSYGNGTDVKEMSWLPITKGQALRVLKREGLNVTAHNRYYKSLGMLRLYNSGVLQKDIAVKYNMPNSKVSYYLNKLPDYKKRKKQ